jgi:tetratricopeptide (TPR) repeat protein
MAQDEHRMLFDLQRGRRKTAVKVVYAILAVLMGLSLFLVVGPLNIGEIFNSNSTTTEAAEQFEEQAETLEAKLKRDPDNPNLLLALTRAHVSAGNSLTVINPETGEPGATPESRQQWQAAADTWSRYLDETDEPNAGLAQMVAPTFVALTLASRSVPEAKRNLDEAVAAQRMVSESRPSLGSFSTLAIYQFYNGEYEAAEKAKQEALKLTREKFEREQVEKQMAGVRGQAELQQAARKKAEKEEAEGGKAGGGAAVNGLGNSLGSGGLLGQ